MGRLEGKTALITGGARGIGRAFAEGYVKEGAKVALGDILTDEAIKAAGDIGAGTVAVGLDVTDQKSIDGCVCKVLEQFGHIDILINCAAVFDMAPIVEISRESFEKVFAANVSGTLFMIQAIGRHMIGRGKGGKIINMASQAGRQGEGLVAVYCASKAAVISLTQSAGYVDTQMWQKVDAMSAQLEQLENGRPQRPCGDGDSFGVRRVRLHCGPNFQCGRRQSIELTTTGDRTLPPFSRRSSRTGI
uniref:Sorbitol dehydrogenase n=1 Tax=Globodera rostochiensis TaxID=31243 RepID=A0A914HV38_GLORO